jgi:hypothetical protein
MSKGKKKMKIYGSDIRGGSSMKGGPWTGGSFLRRTSSDQSWPSTVVQQYWVPTRTVGYCTGTQYCDTTVLWYNSTVVQQYCDTTVLWYNSTEYPYSRVLHGYSVLWYKSTVIQQYCDTTVLSTRTVGYCTGTQYCDTTMPGHDWSLLVRRTDVHHHKDKNDNNDNNNNYNYNYIFIIVIIR